MEISDLASENVLGDLLSDVEGTDRLSRSWSGASTCGSPAGTIAVSGVDGVFITGSGVSTPACWKVHWISGDPLHVGHVSSV